MKRWCILLLALSLVAVTACAGVSDRKDDTEGTPLYFLASVDSVKGQDVIVCSYEPLEIPETATLEDQVRIVVDCLLNGSANGVLYSPFPEDTILLSVAVRDRRAYVDLAGSFSRMDGVALTLADYCLALSLSAVDGIESVTLTANGRALAQQPRQIFRERDVVLSTRDSVVQLVDVTLYFLNEEGVLVGEQRTLEIYEGDTRFGNLVAALLDGPQSEGLFPVIPVDFSISSVKVENGVCRITLPSSTLDALPEDEKTQRLILHSLTDSLYSLDGIREIRISEEGMELEKFGQIDLADVARRPRG